MKLKVMKLTIFSMLFNVLPSDMFTNTSSDKSIFHVIPATENHIKTVIFDLGEVLFTTSRIAQTKTVLSLILKHPSLAYTLWGIDVKQELFKLLNDVPAKTCVNKAIMYNNGKQIPQIMVDWMTCSSDQDICNTTLAHIQETSHSTAVKELFSSITQFMFCPERLVSSQVAIQPMVDLVKTLKERNYKLYVLSNWSKDSSKILIQKHQEIFNLFDGVMISGEEGIGKPHPEFYQRLLKKYNLHASECAFIDDEQYNIKAAKELGIHAILNDSMPSVYQQLSSIGILNT